MTRKRAFLASPAVLALLLVTSLSPLHALPPVLPTDQCTKAYFFFPNGTSAAGGPDWSTPLFAMGPCLFVSGAGVTETFQKTLLVIDSTDSINTVLKIGKDYVYAEEVDLNSPTLAQRPLNITANSYCSTGAHLPSGAVFSIAGEPFQEDFMSKAIPLFNAPYTARLFAPCTDGSCDFALSDALQAHRWYPSSQLLADGRVLIVGGSTKGTAINSFATNEASVEYFPSPAGDGYTRLPFLEESLPYNLYPIVHLLPSGAVFIFAGQNYVLFDTVNNVVFPGNFPPLQLQDPKGFPMMRNYPLQGTSALLPLSPRKSYLAEVIICGGASVAAQQNEHTPADNRCWRIAPLAPRPRWVPEVMQHARVMPLCVLLPDGHLLIHGGAGQGRSGIPSTSHGAVLQPEMYDTTQHSWYRGPLGVSRIPRVYHSSGVLLHDGSVLFSGSNPQPSTHVVAAEFPTEFRTEFYQPPYLQANTPPPEIVRAPAKVTVGSVFQIAFQAQPGFQSLSVVLCQPGFSTHGYNHGMRNVVLTASGLQQQGLLFSVNATAPPTKNIAPPTWYWLFLLVDGVPNRDGQYIFVH